MTYYNIIILIGVLIGLFLFKRTKPIFLKVILIGLVLSFIIFIFEIRPLIYVAFFSFVVLSLIFTFYSGIKWLSSIIGLFAFASFFGKLMHLPYANEMKLLMLIPILCYIMTFRKWETYKSELSILTIFAAFALSEFLSMILLWVK
jgi:hypothetical protein